MIKSGKIPDPPVDSLPELVGWCKVYLPEIVSFINKMRSAKISLVAPVGQAPAGMQIVEAQTGIEIAIPVQFASTIQPIASGGTTDANCRATVTKLLEALTRTGQNP